MVKKPQPKKGVKKVQVQGVTNSEKARQHKTAKEINTRSGTVQSNSSKTKGAARFKGI